MKSLTNKLVMSVLALVMTGVALSIGVYAWFTVNNTATIQAFEANVQTGQGFYVSLNGSTWQNTITTDDLDSELQNVEFVALTSTTGATLVTLANGSAPATGYVDFNLQFVGSSTLNNIRLTNVVIQGSETSWIPGVAVPNTRSSADANAVVTEYASNAARVSFQDIITPATITVVEQSDTTDGNSLGKGTFAGNEAVLFYNAIMTTTPITSTQFTDAVLPATVQASSALTTTVAALYPQSTDITSTGLSYTVPTSVTGVIGTDYKIGAITVRVWVEGWDQEAFNSILSGTLSVSFGFAGIA